MNNTNKNIINTEDKFWREKLRDGSLREEVYDYIKNIDKSKLLSKEDIDNILNERKSCL